MNELLRALVAAGVITFNEARSIETLFDPSAARAYAERIVASVFQGGLARQQQRLIVMLRATGFTPDDAVFAAFWEREARELAREVVPTLTGLAEDVALSAAVRGGGLEAWRAINDAVIEWVEDYYIGSLPGAVGSIPNLNETARTVIGNLVNQWQRGELEAMTREQGLPQLIAAMDEAFGPQRGARIAVTEVTRIFAESKRMAAAANPAVTHLRWATARDDKTCPVCAPLDGTIALKSDRFAGDLFPPAHVNCRCDVSEETALTVDVALGVGGAGTWNSASRATAAR